MSKKLELHNTNADAESILDEFFENCKNGETITYELLYRVLDYLQTYLQQGETKILPNKDVAYHFGIDTLVINIIIQLNVIARKKNSDGQA